MPSYILFLPHDFIGYSTLTLYRIMVVPSQLNFFPDLELSLHTMFDIEGYFSIQIFFIILRETLETAIIISVLLSFINQRSASKVPNSDVIEDLKKHEQKQRKLKLQVWLGAILGLVICFIIGVIFVLCFYFIGKDYWAYAERIWEGLFSLLSSCIITIMGIGLLRINKVMKIKWWIKLGDAYEHEHGSHDDAAAVTVAATVDDDDIPKFVEEPYNQRESIDSNQPLTGGTTTSRLAAIEVSPRASHRRKTFGKKYFLAILPLVTTLREGLEAVVFIGGAGVSQPLSAIAFSVVAGILFGSSMGYLLYKGGNKLSLQYFLICSTCFLYIVSAGLMSRGIWFLELEQYVRRCGGLDVGETGSGPGSYDIARSVWHVNCCDGLKDGWWMVFNAIFGWTNSATYGSVISYVGYWLFVIIWLEVRLYEEREGILPFVPIKWQLNRIRKKVKLYEKRHQQQSTDI